MSTATAAHDADERLARMIPDRACYFFARRYLSLGWAPVAVCPPDHVGEWPQHIASCNGSIGKRPVVRWKEIVGGFAPTRKELERWWDHRHRTRNVGIILGDVSGIVAIDVDGDRGWQSLVAASAGDLPITCEFLTPNGGRRLIYLIPPGIRLRTTHHAEPDVDHEGVSYLAEGGHTVMPPSRHRNGGVYRWLAGRSPWEQSPELAPAWLVAKLLAPATERPPRDRNGKDRLHDVSDLPPSHGPSPLGIIDRARLYLSAIPPAVAGRGGHDATIKAIGVVHRGFDLSTDETFRLAAEWNQGCLPPWSDEELWHKVEDADKHPGARGFLLDDDWAIEFDFGESFIKNGSPAETGKAPPPPSPPPPQPQPTKSLDEFRAEILKARLDSLDTPGVYLDRSPTGAGKSHADLATATAAGSSLTILATHKNCQEVEVSMQQAGLPAAAYPQLTPATCRNYEAAMPAVEAGLGVSSAVCPTCPFAADCEYKSQMADASGSPHAIATHNRAALSFSDLAESHRYIAIHEDPIGLLRPMTSIKNGLDSVRQVAHQAKWDAIGIYVDGPSAAFFNAMEVTAEALAASLTSATETASLADTLPPPIGKPVSCDANLWRAMQKTGVFPPGDIVRIVRAAAAGELAEIVVRVDTVLAPGRALETHKAIMGIWQTTLPAKAAVWINDATANAAEIERLVGRPVADATPTNAPPNLHPIVQITADVKKTSATSTVIKVAKATIQAVVDRFAATRIGVITHKCHVPAIQGTARGGHALPPELQARIAMVEHFHSGLSRGSNQWIDQCDLLLIIGTPRVPSRTIREHLIRTGRTDAAAKSEKEAAWRPITWQATTPSGQTRIVKTSGYTDPDWQAAYHHLVHSELRQAIGRGRSICENGIPVVVVTNENLGLNVTEEKKSDAETEVLKAISDLAAMATNSTGVSPSSMATNPTIYIVESVAITTAEIVERIGKSRTIIKRILASLEKSGQVIRHGNRGGWSLAKPSGECSASFAAPSSFNPGLSASSDSHPH